jgi:hypothetical protein
MVSCRGCRYKGSLQVHGAARFIKTDPEGPLLIAAEDNCQQVRYCVCRNPRQDTSRQMQCDGTSLGQSLGQPQSGLQLKGLFTCNDDYDSDSVRNLAQLASRGRVC